MRLSDYVFERVEKAGVDSVFLVTGRGALFLTDALAKNEKLKHFCKKKTCFHYSNYIA